MTYSPPSLLNRWGTPPDRGGNSPGNRIGQARGAQDRASAQAARPMAARSIWGPCDQPAHVSANPAAGNAAGPGGAPERHLTRREKDLRAPWPKEAFQLERRQRWLPSRLRTYRTFVLSSIPARSSS